MAEGDGIAVVVEVVLVAPLRTEEDEERCGRYLELMR